MMYPWVLSDTDEEGVFSEGLAPRPAPLALLPSTGPAGFAYGVKTRRLQAGSMTGAEQMPRDEGEQSC